MEAAAAASEDDVATTALVAYLRSEADLSDLKAASLRAQANSLAALYGVTQELQQRYAIDPDELPPLDEHGVPKYRGKKRGRKPKARKRKANPNRRKRQHTAYTLFVQETYAGIKALHPDRPSKELIGAVAKEWAAVPAELKKEWKERAQQTHGSGDEDDGGDDEDDDEDENAEEDDEDDTEEVAVEEDAYVEQAAEEEEDDDEEAAPPARRRRRRG